MLEIYDCTPREGEQAEGVSFSLKDRIELCKKLDEFGVDFIELGWPLASEDIFKSFKECGKIMKKAKIVAFGSTSINKNPENDENLNSIVLCGVKYACIFGKSDVSHVEKQLKITKEENLKKIFESVRFLKNKRIKVFYDAEHYFDGFKLNKEYALNTLVEAAKGGADRVVLCDTNGGVLPEEARAIVSETLQLLKTKKFNVEIGVHFHDDSGLALANTLSCLDFIKQVQGTINGIGERIGNLNFSEFLPVYIKKLGKKLNVNLKKLKEINEETFRLAGIAIPEKRSFVGDLAFSHKAGVHIDAHIKGASYEHANPEDFGNKRTIILNSLGGRSSVVELAKKFGYELDKNDLKLREKIQDLFDELKGHEEKGYRLGTLEAEQFLLIEKYFGSGEEFFKIEEWGINSGVKNNKEVSIFRVGCRINDELVEEELSVEGGPVDAVFKTLKKIIGRKYVFVEDLQLIDFHVSIARQKGEESSVRTEIYFSDGEDFSTVGVDKNILQSSIEALEKGFRYFLKKSTKSDYIKKAEGRF